MSTTTLAALASLPIWVSWQTERPDGRKPTKVPYGPNGKASADDPSTWCTRAEAEATAHRLPKPFGTGGVGLEFAGDGNGLHLGGVDLDTCRDPATGAVAPWAAEMVARLGTYAEISPSGTGLKSFFLYNITDLPAFHDAMGSAQHGKQFKRSGGDHPPAIELYLDRRYFAVTDQHFDGTPLDLRVVPAGDILWILRDAGPAFAKAGDRGAGSTAKGSTHGGADQSRSAAAFRLGMKLRRAGKIFKEAVEAIRTDPETAEWCREKGEANDQRELKRIWEHAGSPFAASQPDIEDEKERVVAEFNTKYAVVNENGRTVVLAPRQDEMLHRLVYDRMTFTDLRDFYMNRLIKVGSDSKGNPNYLSVAKVWLGHRERRQYNEVVFAPGKEARPGVLNLWNGFNVRPAPGDWSILREHIRTVLCAGDDTHFNYLIGWMARLLQRPGEQGEVAVVVGGEEGAGKGTLARVLIRILGQHGLAISNAKHLIGSFNAHLRDCIFLFADEAFFAGDKAHVGVLKALITEPHLTVEAKYANAVQMPNFVHLMMASNADWMVAAGLQARRFFVLNATSEHRNDHPYFARLWEQMENGGYEAMLHDLLALDLSGFNVRQPPATEALEEQKKLTLPIPEQWWADCLHRGGVVNPMGLEEFARWEPFASTSRLHASYMEFARARGERHPLSREDLGRFMRRMGAQPSRPRNAPTGEHLPATAPGPRPPGYALGNLDEARATFVKAIKLNVEWPHEDEPAEEPLPEELAEELAWIVDETADEIAAALSPFALLARE